MKVAVVTNYFPTSPQPWGGHSAYQTLRELAKLCHVHVFCHEASYPRWLAPGGKSTIDFAWRPPDVPVTYVAFPTLPVVSRPLNGVSIARRVLPHVRAFAPDVVLNYVIYPSGYAAVRVAAALGVPAVLTAIGSDLNRIAPLCGAWTRAALRRADEVTAVSHDLEKTAVRLGADPMHTAAILNGCDTGVFHPRDRAASRVRLGLEADAEIAVYVGRFDVRKGLMELVEAVAAVRVERQRLRCFLVGDGPDRKVLEEAVAKFGAGEAVTFVPPCRTEEVAAWMGAADLVTLPSYKEGCPNVVIEALASGRPVVATNVGGIPELMDERSGRLVKAKDVAGLKTALAEVLEEPWDAEAIAARHSRSWADVAGDVYGVLEEVVAGR